MKRVLFVVTSTEQIPKTRRSTGAYISEVAHPYFALTSNGVEVDFVSPSGGETPLDGLDEQDDITRSLLDDSDFLQKIHSAMTPNEVVTENYNGIFFAGGHGTMFDFPENQGLLEITKNMFQVNKIVAAVCHGPAALVNIRLDDGNYLVAGKKLTSFSNEEEQETGLVDAMPFLLETLLKDRGAIYSQTAKFESHVVIYKNLITGQNPASAKGVGMAILDALQVDKNMDIGISA